MKYKYCRIFEGLFKKSGKEGYKTRKLSTKTKTTLSMLKIIYVNPGTSQ